MRVFGVPDSEKQALAAFFARVNDDYRQRVKFAAHHGAGEVQYGYLSLNCAKTIGMGFKLGAGYEGLEVKDVNLVGQATGETQPDRFAEAGRREPAR